MEKEWKEWITKSITADELLNLGPCFVTHICLTSKATGPATVLIYNGHDTAGEVKLALSAIGDTHFGDEFNHPIYFDKGLYIDIGNYVELFTIQYKNAETK